MKKLLSFAGALALGFALCTSSFADIVDNSGAGFAIPDNDPAGTTSVINIAADECITDVAVTLFATDHTWIGDMTVTITSPSGTTADLMVRVGDTTGGAGDSSDLGGDYTFADGGADLWAAAGAAGGADVIASGTYAATGIGDAGTGTGTPVSLAALFAGEKTAGAWTLFASDGAGGDLGNVGSWGLNITSTAVPEPGSLVLLGAMGVACIVRRRR